MIALNAPMQIQSPATSLRCLSISWSTMGIQVSVAWHDSLGNVVKQDSVTIVGADFAEIDSLALVGVPHGVTTVSGALLLAIENKLISMLGLTALADGQF